MKICQNIDKMLPSQFFIYQQEIQLEKFVVSGLNIEVGLGYVR